MTELSRLLSLPLVELARLLRDGQLRPIEVVDAHIARILHENARLNAVVANRFEDARAQARAMEAARVSSSSSLPALWGVPCTVKECFGVAGLPHTVGSKKRARHVAERSATVVARVEQAGAIVLGVTNLPELAMAMETSNLVYGRTNNPWDLSRTAGGSSGGEAAIVAAGGSPLGIASDIGGSIRIPAMFCGVVGHKPSGGLVPGTGHVPFPSTRARRFTTYGPIVRSARDVMPVLRVLAGPDGEDPACTPMPLHDPSTVALRGLRVLTIADDGRHDIAEDLRAAQARAARALAERGARVEQRTFPELRRAFEMWGDALKRTADRAFESWLAAPDRLDDVDSGLSLLRELRALVTRSDPVHTLPALAFVLLERIAARVDFTKGAYDEALAFKDALLAELGDGVLLLPPFPTTAPKHGGTARSPTGFALSGLFAVFEMCATEVPLGFGQHHLPTGTQVLARPGNDHVTVAVAQALEEDLGGWRLPPD